MARITKEAQATAQPVPAAPAPSAQTDSLMDWPKVKAIVENIYTSGEHADKEISVNLAENGPRDNKTQKFTITITPKKLTPMEQKAKEAGALDKIEATGNPAATAAAAAGGSVPTVPSPTPPGEQAAKSPVGASVKKRVVEAFRYDDSGYPADFLKAMGIRGDNV